MQKMQQVIHRRIIRNILTTTDAHGDFSKSVLISPVIICFKFFSSFLALKKENPISF